LFKFDARRSDVVIEVKVKSKWQCRAKICSIVSQVELQSLMREKSVVQSAFCAAAAAVALLLRNKKVKKSVLTYVLKTRSKTCSEKGDCVEELQC